MKRALIIKGNWLDKIFHNNKTWEMRSSRTNIRGKIGLIESGSGQIVGEAEITHCFPITDGMKISCQSEHQVYDLRLLKKWRYAWVLSNVKKYDKPIPYTHPRGAVIWVKIHK